MDRPQHTHRPVEAVLGAIRENYRLLAELIAAANDLGPLIDVDLRELYERQVHKGAAFGAFILANIGRSPNSIRCVLNRVQRDHQLLTAGPEAPRRAEFPQAAGGGRSRRPNSRPSGKVPHSRRIAEVIDEGEDPMVGWLGYLIAQVPPVDAIDQSSDERLEVIQAWVDEFQTEARSRGFCEHHPEARTNDGRVCTDCGKQVLK